jgi:hypothetical protein
LIEIKGAVLMRNYNFYCSWAVRLKEVAMGIALAPEQYPNCHARDVAVQFGSGALELLLMRMEALQLEPGEVRHIEPSVFSDLAKACATCENKNSCESDLAYGSAGTVTRDWENFRPNAAILNAMTALPWFGNLATGRQTE